MLAWTIYLSFLGALHAAGGNKRPQAARIIALLTALAGLAIANFGGGEVSPGRTPHRGPPAVDSPNSVSNTTSPPMGSASFSCC